MIWTEEQRLEAEIQEHTYDCSKCRYFIHAQTDPEHAQTTCPICGLRLIEQGEDHAGTE